MSLLTDSMTSGEPVVRTDLVLDPEAEVLCGTLWRVATNPTPVIRLSGAGVLALAGGRTVPHAAGQQPSTRTWGPTAPQPVARAAVVVRLAQLVRTGAPVRVEVVAAALALLRAGLVPVTASIPVGAGPDGEPQRSSLVAALEGTGEVLGPDGRPTAASAALPAAGLAPVRVDAQEREALADGISAPVAAAALAVVRARRIVDTALDRHEGHRPVLDAGARHLDHARTLVELALNSPTAEWAPHVGMAADAVTATVTHVAMALTREPTRSPSVAKMRRHCLAHAVGPDPLEGCGVAAAVAFEQVDRLAALLAAGPTG